MPNSEPPKSEIPVFPIIPRTAEDFTLEKYGGKAYKKYSENLSIEGNRIKTPDGIFTSEDVGMIFCGLYSHKNPLMTDFDRYYPNIIGSRYSIVTRFISKYEIEVNFTYNLNGSRGYVFFDNTQAWEQALKQESHIKLDAKSYVILEIKPQKVASKFLISCENGRANLQFGVEDYFKYLGGRYYKNEGHLFSISDGADFLSDNVNFISPYRAVQGAELHYINLFNTDQSPDAKWNVFVRNCDVTKNQIRPEDNSVGMGLGFMYGGKEHNYVGLKNFKHRGPGLMDLKNPWEDCVLYGVFENIQTDYLDKQNFMNPNTLVKGFIKDNVFTITSDHTVYCIFDFGFTDKITFNSGYILHLDRFTWMIDGRSSIIDSNSIRLRSTVPPQVKIKVKHFEESGKVVPKVFVLGGSEAHVGDSFILNSTTYRIVRKDRTINFDWTGINDPETAFNPGLDIDKDLPTGYYPVNFMTQGNSLSDGINKDAYLIAKGNAHFKSEPGSKFGDHIFVQAPGTGHLSYNHNMISIWAKNFAHNGYYRQTANGKGKTLGFTLINCKGFDYEFNPSVAVANNGDMPERAKKYMDSDR